MMNKIRFKPSMKKPHYELATYPSDGKLSAESSNSDHHHHHHHSHSPRPTRRRSQEINLDKSPHGSLNELSQPQQQQQQQQQQFRPTSVHSAQDFPSRGQQRSPAPARKEMTKSASYDNHGGDVVAIAVQVNDKKEVDQDAEDFELGEDTKQGLLKTQLNGKGGGGSSGASSKQTLDKDSRIKTHNDGPIFELRGREVVFAILVFFFFSVSIGLVVVLASNKLKEISAKGKAAADQAQAAAAQRTSDNGKTLDTLCLTKACLRRTAAIMDNMDDTVDRCQDFWMYACGGYLAKTEIPRDESSWGVDKELVRTQDANIRALLESPIVRNTSLSVERKVKTMYNKCMDVRAIERLGDKPLTDILNTFGGWAVLDDWNLGAKSGRWNFKILLRELHSTYATNAFFQMILTLDDMDSTKHSLQLDEAGLGMDRRLYFLPDSHADVKAYRTYMRTVAQLFNASDSSIDQFVDSTYDFEQKLAQIHLGEESYRSMGPGAAYNELTVAELQELSPRIDWLDFLRPDFTTFTTNSTVVVTNRDYFANLSLLISTTNQRVLNYYMIWRMIQDFAIPLLPARYRDATDAFHSAVKNVRSKDRWRVCLDRINMSLGSIVSSLFVMHHFSRESRDDVEHMIQDIQGAFLSTINGSKWPDTDSKGSAIDKLLAMGKQIGYADYITNTAKMDAMYELLPVSEADSFFQLVVNYVKYTRSKMVVTLPMDAADVVEWGANPHDVNAFYSFLENSMIFPAGVLQNPFYDPDVPEYVNYGSIGTTIGHEMTHAFLGFGSNYDKDGNLNPLWKNESRITYELKVQCIADYYSTFVTQENGVTTVREDMADVMGLRVAYKAYLAREEEQGGEAQLPGLGLTNTQVFFLTFAQNHCKKRRPESLEGYLMNSPYSVEELRVNGSTSQSPDFADAFGCTPAKKCDIW